MVVLFEYIVLTRLVMQFNKYNKEQIKELVEFQERFFEYTIITC